MTDSLDAAFSALGDETRIDILRVLGEADDQPSFSELRERAGVRDSGQFNYHLGKLRGHYVEKSDDGYVLTREGMRVTGAIVGNAYASDQTQGPEPAPFDCTVCGSEMHVVYEDSAIRLQCQADGDHSWLSPVPPGALEHHDLADLVRLGTTLNRQHGRLVFDGTCPQCFGPMERGLRPAGDFDTGVGGHDYLFQAVCEACGFPLGGGVGALVTEHPAVVSAYYDHGVDVRERVQLPHELDPPAVESETPLRLRVDVDHPDPDRDERLVSLVVDDTPEVVEVRHHD